MTLVEQDNARSAVVEAESADGEVVRVFTLHKVEGGWAPGGYLECSY